MNRDRSIRTLLLQPCAPGGVGSACLGILGGAAAAGRDATLFTTRLDMPAPAGVEVRTALSWAGPTFGAMVGRIAQPVLPRQFVKQLRPGDIAHVWPGAPISLLERIRATGALIVAEAVNTRMAAAKVILDAAYDALDLPATHGITDDRIALQNARHALADAIFAPSPAVEASLVGSVLEHAILPSSYGTRVPWSLPARPTRAPGDPVTVLFAGTAGVRKGIHLLLDIWPALPDHIHLRIVGRIEPAIRDRYADTLNRVNVTTVAFTPDLPKEYLNADIFALPSLEEGDPLVTYEAAAHGLPAIATPIGAGRLGATTGCVTTLSGPDRDELADSILELAASEGLRRFQGAAARAAVRAFDWSVVGPARFEQMLSVQARAAAKSGSNPARNAARPAPRPA